MAESAGSFGSQILKITQAKYDFSYRDIGRWLPFAVDPASIEDFLANVAIYPQALPVNVCELELYQALAREVLHWQKKEEKEVETVGDEIQTLVIGEEILKICRNHKDGLLIALDGFLPEGIVEFFAHGENGLKVATAICFAGEGVWKKDKAGQVAQVTLDFGLSQKQKVILEADDLMLIPADAKEQIKIKIHCTGSLRIAKKKDLAIEATGGTVGIVFDTRGRPFKFPEFGGQGRERLILWRKSLGIWSTAK